MPYDGFIGHGIYISLREYTNPSDRSKCIAVVVSFGRNGVGVKQQDVDREIWKVLKAKLHTTLLAGEAYNAALGEINKYESHADPKSFFLTTAPVERLSAFVEAFDGFVKAVTPYFIHFNPRLISER